MPTRHNYEREEIHEMFRELINLVQPEHSYKDDAYPVSRDELRTTWKRGDSNSWAHCGPRSGKYTVSFAVDLGYFNRSTTERILCILNHEMSHITEGSHTDGSAHNPRFWEAVAFHATEILDNKSVVEEIVGEFDTNEFIDEVTLEPNNPMTDGRIETVEERREKMRELLSGYKE